MELILILFFFLFFLIVLSIITLLLLNLGMIAYTRVPYAPTPHETIERIINELDIRPGQVVYDLGCGDGRFLFAAEKKGAQATGYEVSPLPFLKARGRQWLTKSRARIYPKNFFSAHVFDADIVFCFLVGAIMPQVETKLKNELPHGARVASYGFAFPGWRAQRVIHPEPRSRFNSPIFIYVK